MEHSFNWSRHYAETNKRHGEQKGAAAENIFSLRSGLTSYFCRGVELTSPLKSFCLVIEEFML